MKVVNKCFGYELSVNVPDDVESFDKLAGKPGAALNEAIKNVLYRSWNNEFRLKFCEAIEKETGIKWPVDEKKTAAQKKKADGTQTNIHITEGEYFDLVLASNFTREQFTELANKVAAEIEFDPSAGERGSGKVGKEYMAAAEQLLKEDDTVLAGKITKLQTLNPGLVIALDAEGGTRPTQETLAKAIKVNADRKLREAMEELN